MARIIACALAFATALVALDAAPMPTGDWPASTGTVTKASAIVVSAGTTFDGKMQTYERSDITCKGQASTSETSVFIVEPGATLKNVIIGRNQMEGVVCERSDCTIENMWVSDVCEAAVAIQGGSVKSVSRVVGGGARYADDKIVLHNGAGSVSIDGFFAEDFGRLYRSCSTCGAIQRSVNVSNVLAMHPTVNIVTVNSNYGDVATLSNIRVLTSKPSVEICGKMIGAVGGEAKKAGSGPDSTICKFSANDILINDAPAASGPTQPPASPSAPVLTPSPAQANVTPDKPSAPQPQQPVAGAVLPGRVQAPPSFEGLSQTLDNGTPSAGSAPSLNTQSLSFKPAPTPTTLTPSAAISSNSYGFRVVGSRPARK